MAKWWVLVGGIALLYAQDTCQAIYEIAGYTEWDGAVIEVTPSGRYDTVDANGFFRIHGLCKGAYKVRVWVERHCVAETWVEVPQNTPLVIENPDSLHVVVIKEHLPRAFHVMPVQSLLMPEKGLAEQITRVPGAALSQAGPFISKPILEGLRGTRICYWQGGQPLTSQQWGEDHAPEIDPFSTDEIEIKLGPSPVRHGTEAVGGLVILPLPSVCCLKGIQGQFILSGMENGRGGLFGFRLQGGVKGWGYRFQGSFLRVGTLRTPLYYLTGTGTAQAHGSFTLHKLWERWQLRIYYAQYNAEIGIFQGMHTGNLSDFQLAINALQPPVASTFSYRLTPPYQHVEHELLSSQITYLAADNAIWTLTAGRQYDRRREYDLVGIYTRGTGIALDLQLTSYFLQLTHERQQWFFGAFYQYQRNYRQYAYFIPAYQRHQGGLFAIYHPSKWEVGFRAEPVRYEFRRAVLKEGGMPIEHIERVFIPWAVEVTRLSKVRAHWSFLTRAPNPAELYAYGYHQAQAAFYIGGNDLRIEPTLAFRLSQEREDRAWGLSTYYSPAFIWEKLGGPILSLRGAALALQYHQTPAAWLSISGRWTKPLSSSISWEARGAYVWGNVYASQPMPMPLLPPLVLTFTLRGRYKKWQAEVFWQQQFQQWRYSLASEYLPPPKGYGLLGAEVGWQGRAWQVVVSGENLLNHVYRAYPDLMRFFAIQVGRQVRLTVRYEFGSQ